ncbi:MAG: FtsX-like permease family protein [Acidobacteria bacterium]|nr:FtsX-like permease family protein [Acidobacteriota bacterium]
MKDVVSGWAWRMAWRDSRGSRRRLLLYVSSIVAGVAALVAVASFQDNLTAAIEERSKALLGADVRIDSRRDFSGEAEELVRSLGGRQSRQIEFSSMAYFPAADGTRLVSVRALEGDYPYYGELETIPAGAAVDFRDALGALVDENLLLQYDIEVGDEIRLGLLTFVVAGRLQNVAGEIPTRAMISPRVYIPMRYLEATELIQPGSRAQYTAFVAFDDPELDADALVEELRPELRRLRLDADTVTERREQIGTVLGNLNSFLSLVGFGALLLGSLGVASSIHLYVSGKVETVAVLRCMGARAHQAMAVFVIQVLVLGVLGATLGALVGIGIQKLLPRVLAGVLPAEVPFFVSPWAIAEGISVGTAVAVLFGLFPLLAVRNVSPLLALRSLGEQDAPARRDPLRWALASLIVASCGTYLIGTSPSWRSGWILFGGMLGVFAALFAVAKGIMWLARALPTASLAYETRQGLANLYRPRNQTALLMLSLGLGTFLILTLILVQASLVAEVGEVIDQNALDLIVWDIQVDQLAGVLAAFDEQGLVVERGFPVVPMRLAAVDGVPVAELPDAQQSWATRWDYSATYRQDLRDSERIIEGEWVGRIDRSVDWRAGTDPVPISVSVQVTEELSVGVGARLTFDVQSIPLETVIASIRRVEWEEAPPNFLVVFPQGALDGAPQFHVLVSRVDTRQASAAIQRRLVRDFPNVAIIDLKSVMQTIDDILGDITFIIRFMAMFSVVTGGVVLVAAVVTSRLQRIREGVLLRTLGASRAQIYRILLAEYLFLGSFAAATGLLLSLIAAWSLTHYLFEVVFEAPLGVLGASAALIVAVTVAVGMLNSRGICSRPPLEVLRSEVL